MASRKRTFYDSEYLGGEAPDGTDLVVGRRSAAARPQTSEEFEATDLDDQRIPVPRDLQGDTSWYDQGTGRQATFHRETPEENARDVYNYRTRYANEMLADASKMGSAGPAVAGVQQRDAARAEQDRLAAIRAQIQNLRADLDKRPSGGSNPAKAKPAQRGGAGRQDEADAARFESERVRKEQLAELKASYERALAAYEAARGEQMKQPAGAKLSQREVDAISRASR